jgi:hypothetical protein
MPVLLVPLIESALAFLIDVGVTEVVVFAIATVIADIAFAYAVGRLASALAGNRSANNQPVPQTFMARGTVYPRSMIYGATRTSGVVVFEYTATTTGTANESLYFVVAIAGHQLDVMGDTYFDNVQIVRSWIDNVTGVITVGQFAGYAQIFFHLGTDGQTVDADLNAKFTAWDTNHRGRGVAYLVVRCVHNTTVYSQGPPQNFFVSVKGRRLYDPRLDSTNGGSGSQRVNDATTWSFSSNPALACADYITGGSTVYDVATPIRSLGMGEDPSRIDWALVANAANICDQSCALPVASQTRYVIAGVLSCSDTHAQNLGKITAAMSGQVVYRGGKYRIYAGAYDSPTQTFTDSDLIGSGYEILAPGRANLYNTVSPIYVDPARNFQQVTSAINQNSTYVTADGEAILRSVDLTLVDNEYRAQRIGALILAQSRNLISVTLYFGINGFTLSTWDTFFLTLVEPGWVNKVFRVTDWKFNPDQPGVTITAREESSAAYGDPLGSSYAAPGTATAGANTQEGPDAPTALTISGIPNGIQFVWTPGAYVPKGATYEIWEYTANTPFSSATRVLSGHSGTTAVIAKSDTTARFYWVRCVTHGGVVSGTFPAGNGQSGAAITADTAWITDGAVSQITSNYSATLVQNVSTVSGTVVDTTIITAPSMTTTGLPVAVDVTCVYAAGTIGSASPVQALVSVYRDGSIIASSQYDASSNIAAHTGAISPVPITLSVTDLPAAGAHVYTLHYRGQSSGTTGQVTANFTNNFIKVREYKK